MAKADIDQVAVTIAIWGLGLDEFSTFPDAEPIIGGIVCVSVIVAPRGMLFVIDMANDCHGNEYDGCADD